MRSPKEKGHPIGWPRYNPFYRVCVYGLDCGSTVNEPVISLNSAVWLHGVCPLSEVRLSVPTLSPRGLPLGSDAVSRDVIVDI